MTELASEPLNTELLNTGPPGTHPTSAGEDARMRTRANHAVVVGGGLAGQLAAAVLGEHYERVTVVERDRYPDQPAFRKGVPQAHQFHMLWAQGLALIERLLPGVSAELVGLGAVPIEWPTELLWLSAAGWSRQFPPTMRILSVSRPVLDWAVREWVGRRPGVTFLTGHEVTGLLTDRAATTVTGVRLLTRGQARAAGHARLTADLLVDATGRSSRMPQWLTELGLRAPQEIRVNPDLGYASRQYEIPGHHADWKALLINAKAPDVPRAGNLFQIEGDRWMATLVGAGGQHPPVSDEGFLEFAKSLRSPLLYEAIRDARPTSPVRGYRRTGNVRRRYESLSRMPDRLVVLGDAACALNPVYAHGMTVAAREAAALADCLAAHPTPTTAGLSRRIQRQVANCAKGAWLIATGEDAKYPFTEGIRANPVDRLVGRYLDRVARAACRHRKINARLLDVLNLTVPPEKLFRPDIAVRALFGSTKPLHRPAG